MKNILLKLINLLCLTSLLILMTSCTSTEVPDDNNEQDKIEDVMPVDNPLAHLYQYDKLPDGLTDPIEESGLIEQIDYTTEAYSAELLNSQSPGTYTSNKSLMVYTPYGYDETQSYNILYLIHPSKASELYWFNAAKINIIVDHLIQQGLIDPLIIVTPSFYYNDVIDFEDLRISNYDHRYFYLELRNVIMPMVESKYSTYAKTADDEGFIESRDHRAIAGCSRGSRTTISSGMVESLDYFSYFGAFEGISSTADEIINAINSERFESYPIHFMYNGQGTLDFSRSEHVDIYEALVAAQNTKLVEGVNMVMVDKIGFNHNQPSWILDTYNFLTVDAFKHH